MIIMFNEFLRVSPLVKIEQDNRLNERSNFDTNDNGLGNTKMTQLQGGNGTSLIKKTNPSGNNCTNNCKH